MSETFSAVIDRAMAECDGRGMLFNEAMKHIMRAIAQKLDELHSHQPTENRAIDLALKDER